MASFRLADQDDDDTLEPNTPDVKRPCTDEDQYNKVLNRPYIAPSVSDHSILDHSSGAAEDDEAKTSHYDYNFDEKDYKNRRKTSTKYHEPLRRISTHRNEFQHHDKKSVKRHKKLKKENEREARLKQLVNHEEVKAESRKQSGHRRHGVTSAPVTKELDQTDGGEAPEEDNTEDVVNNDTVPSLASREDDTIDETESLPSPRNRYNDSKNKPETFELQEIKVEVPIKENVTSAKQVPSLSSREDKIEPLEPLPSLAAQKDGIQPVQQQLNDDIKIDEVKNHISTKDDSGRQNKPEVLQSKTVPERGTHPEKDSPTEKTTATEKSKVSSIEAIPGKAVAAQKAVTNKVKETAEDEDDEDVGIQMKQIRKDGELPSGKQMRKFVPKDRDSFIDIMPKIHEHDTESTDEPHSIVVSRQHGVNDRSGKAIAEQLDIESHHRDKDRIQPDLLRQGHKRHHHHRKHHHRKHEIKQHRTISEREALAERSRLRSGLLTLQETEANYAELRKRTDSIEGEEEDTLQKKDLEEIAWHRFEDLRGLRRRRPHLRKTRLKSGTLTRQSSSDTLTASVLDFPVKYDHTPHEPFIELQELTHREEGMVWRETARWIKFEEDVEASNRWGRPHVASLTFQSLLELRKGLEKGTVLLDLEQFDIHSIVETIAENMVITDQLPREEKDAVIDALLLKHRHQYQEATNIPRRSSFYNMMPFSQSTAKDDENKFPEQPEALKNEDGVICLKIDEDTASDFSVDDGMKSQMPLCVSDTEGSPATKREVTFAPPKPAEKGARKNESNVKSRIPADAEATAVMVGALKSLQNPVLAFVRLAKGVQLEGLTEVDIPCRFIFVMLGPAEKEDTYYEIGRSISTLMSDQVFHDLAYYSESREDILQAINEFLDDTIVLPPGEWDRQLLIPLLMGQSKVMAKRRKEAKQINAIAVAAAEEQDGPLKRTGRYCGGLIRDIKRRAEYYVSDFKDGLNLHSLWVILFLYFAVFAPNIAFGGLLADKTENWMGISEVIFATCLCGILFGLFAGQPLIIIGATGPVLVFEQSIYQFCKSFNIEFLPWRFWIGMWVMIILFIVVLFEGCFLVRYFTRFTEEVFGCLISAIFIYEALSYLVEVFKANPLSRKFSNGTRKVKVDSSIFSATNEPNTALMSVILLFGTFCVAFYMQKVRHSHFFGKQMRRLISDLGIIIAMASMSFLDLTVGNSVVVDKVSFGNPFTVGFRPTKYRERGWIINPIGLVETIHPGLPFAAIVPALFIGILLFMETELTGVLLNKKENNLQKLPGFNIDLVLMGILSFICGLFGLPWMCAATVRSLSHFTALSVWSTSHAPGERPFLIEVKEQRVTNIAIHVLTGISIMLAPLLHQIPVSVVFGVLLYLGVASLSHIQLVNRIIMLFMPPKHHPDVRYVRKVHTSRIYWFTAVQIGCLLILMAVKLTSVAPAFPFFIICLIPLRKLLSRFFTKEELEELDNEEGDESEDDDLDMLMHR